MTSVPTVGNGSGATFSGALAPRAPGGGGSFRWAVGVYAAPRKEATLARVIASLQAAGWTPTIQAEPNTFAPKGVRTVFNPARKGVVHNFRALALRLLEENPDADTLMTCQDDAEFHPDSKTFAESILWPAEDTAFVSLYCSRAHSMERHELLPPGVRKLSAPYLWGDLALIWPRAVLEAYVRSPLLVNWRGTPGDLRNLGRRITRAAEGLNPYLRGLLLSGEHLCLRSASGLANPYPRGSDVAAGMFARAEGMSMWVVDPSPVRHIAFYSTIAGHGDNTGNRNCARPADHRRPLLEQVFPACQSLPVRYSYSQLKGNVHAM